MIFMKEVHQCDLPGCGKWSASPLKTCAICEKEFCDGHTHYDLVITTRVFNQRPLGAFPPMCHSCVSSFKKVKQKHLAEAVMEAVKASLIHEGETDEPVQG